LETSWCYTESISSFENVYMSFHFHVDTLLLTKTYYNPNSRKVTLNNNKNYDSTFKFTVFINDKVRIYPVIVEALSKKTVILPTGEINWIRYIKAPIYNKHYEIPPGPPPDNINLVFTWKRKEYADASYQIPIIDNSPLIDWFLWKIDENGDLLMGEVDSQRQCWYWKFKRE